MVPQAYQNLCGAIGQIVSLHTSRLWCSRMSFRPPGEGSTPFFYGKRSTCRPPAIGMFADSVTPNNPEGSSYSPDTGTVATVPPNQLRLPVRAYRTYDSRLGVD